MLLHACTIALSAFLLFLVQPIIARQILPWFGGSAAVWTTCMVFFQVALLAGYFYSDWVIRRLQARQQAMVHTGLLIVSLAFLPIIASPAFKPDDASQPIGRILVLLTLTIGLPYLMLATTGPLVQAWFSREFSTARVYRLYALSNLASMIALIIYPPAIEPLASGRIQAIGWSVAYGAFAILAVLCAWRAAKLGSKDDQCVIQHPAALQVFEQPRNRLVDLRGEVGVILLDARVRIPGTAATTAMEDLDEAHATLRHPARCKTHLSKLAGVVLVHPVQGLRFRGLFLKAKRFGDGRLHLEGQLIGLDACAEVFVAGVVNPTDAVEAAEETEVFALLIGSHRVRRRKVRQRLFRVGREADSCVFRSEVAGAMCPSTAAAVTCRCSQNDKFREVFIERPKAVGGPAPDGWVGAFAYVPAGLKCQLRAVVVINRPEAADNGEVIRTGANFLKPVTHFQTAFTVALIARLQRHDDLAISMIWVPSLNFRADFFRVKDIRVRGFID